MTIFMVLFGANLSAIAAYCIIQKIEPIKQNVTVAIAVSTVLALIDTLIINL